MPRTLSQKKSALQKDGATWPAEDAPAGIASRAGTGSPGIGLGRVWAGLATATVVLALLLTFILENSGQVAISYFGATGHVALGVAILLGAVSGIVLTLLLGSVRLLQLRARARHLAR